MTSFTSFKRSDRVGDLIKSEISGILLKDVRDPRIKNITITGVKMSDDLRSAKIFFVPLGKETCNSETIEGLKSASKFLRRELGKKLQLRYVPDINFIYDSSFEHGDRIDRLLAEIQRQKTTDDKQNC
ncbi:MAG: 30S ribosome-binding factor RbfA [Deltaproteobacteria bacterium]|nr:30S ribosome-binding factor RbfA [Deltaproteobacteria bacterium]